MSKEDLSKYEKRRRLEILMSFYAISVSVNFVVSLSLLAGVKLERRWLLLPWVGWNSLTLVTNQMAVFLAPNKVQYGMVVLNRVILPHILYCTNIYLFIV